MADQTTNTSLPPVKKQLVLTGGAIKGAYQAGALLEIFKTGWTPDKVSGVSIGALNGAFVVQERGKNPTGDPVEIGESIIKFWQDNIKSASDVARQRPILSLIWSIISKNWQGVIDTKPYKTLVHNLFETNYISKADWILEAGIVNLKSGGYFDAVAYKDNFHLELSGHSKGTVVKQPISGYDEFIEYVMASGSTPLLYPTSYVAQNALVDGGARNVAPLTNIDVLDATDEILVVCTHPELIDEEDDTFDPKDVVQLASRVSDIAVNEIVNDDIRIRKLINRSIDNGVDPGVLGYSKVKMKVIRPATNLPIDLMNFDSADIQNLINIGKADAKAAMEGSWF